jgi:hypothetical protein
MGKIIPVCTIKAPRGVEVYLHSHPHQWLEVSGHLHILVALPLGKIYPLHMLIEYEALGPQNKLGWFGL